MCWRSQRNSRALIRTSPGWQLVNSVLRIGVLYSCTKECKLVPVPSGHWEQIHMAHTLTLKRALSVAPQCNFPQSIEKQAGLMTRPTRTAVLFVCVRACACVCESEHVCVSPKVIFCYYNKKSAKSLETTIHTHSHKNSDIQSEHFILKPHLRAKYGVPTGDLIIALVFSFNTSHAFRHGSTTIANNYLLLIQTMKL